MIFYSPFIILFIFYILIVVKRAKKYKYSTDKDYIYSLEKNLTKIVLNAKNFDCENKDYDTLFLKVELSFNFISYFFKPYIKIENQKHYFEYGAKGVRYINISHIKKGKIDLIPKHISLKNRNISIYGYNNNINFNKDTLLILAPHADDAEIAGFGLYKSMKNVTIVTITIGEHGRCNYCDIYHKDENRASVKKAELRTIDALNIGLYGGVNIENSLALGYFGGSLKWMKEHPNEKASSLRKSIKNMNSFRKVSHANIKLKEKVEPTYNSLLDDIKSIIEQINPTLIMTPHPIIDSHPDHKQITYALIDAIKATKHKCKILTYTNHLSLSESYPVGNLYSPITLPPSFKEFYFDNIYSFKLNNDLQIDKLFALEAIHDLRDSSIQISIKKAYKQLDRLITRKIKGKDASYYRRAVRANELFFVIDSENVDKLQI